MDLYLGILAILFAVVGAALLLRGAWLTFRGQYRHGLIHMGLALLALVVALGFSLARGVFVA